MSPVRLRTPRRMGRTSVASRSTVSRSSGAAIDGLKPSTPAARKASSARATSVGRAGPGRLGLDRIGPAMDADLLVEGAPGVGGGRPDDELAADRVFDGGRVAADRPAVLVQDGPLVLEQREIVHRQPHLPDVGVAGDDAQALLLAGRADDERDAGLDRPRRVARAVEAIARRLDGSRSRPSSSPRTIVQRFVEPVEPLADAAARIHPVGVTSSSRLPAPSPSTRRPPLMWSTVAAILATTPGLRNGLAPTSRPSRTRFVTAAQAASVVQPSKNGWNGSPPVEYRWSWPHR